MNKELLQQTLDALNDSLDCVQIKYAVYLENYGDYPSRKAHIDMLKSGVDKHKAAIKALEVAIAQSEPGKLLQIIAAMYQIAGVYDAPEHVLDVVANPEGATQEQIDALLPFAQPEQTANLETYIAANYPDAKGETIFERCIDSLETMDKALGYASIAQPMPATSAKPASGDVTDDDIQKLNQIAAQLETDDHFIQGAWARAFKNRLAATSAEPASGIKEGESMQQAAEGWAQWCEVRGNQMLANFLRKQVEGDAKDAERYRWLREQHWKSKTFVVTTYDQLIKHAQVLPGNGSGFDKAIDAAIASQKATP